MRERLVTVRICNKFDSCGEEHFGYDLFIKPFDNQNYLTPAIRKQI